MGCRKRPLAEGTVVVAFAYAASFWVAHKLFRTLKPNIPRQRILAWLSPMGPESVCVDNAGDERGDAPRALGQKQEIRIFAVTVKPIIAEVSALCVCSGSFRP